MWGVLPEHITLYLTTPLERTERMLREVVRRCGIHETEPYPFIIAVPTTGTDLYDLIVQLGTSLSPTEQQLTKCWMSLDGNEPSHAQLMQAQALHELIAWGDSQWLSKILQDDRLTTFFQPIVDIHRPSRVVGSECLLRGLGDEGKIIPPDRLYQAARATGMLYTLDLAAQRTALHSTATHDLDGLIFINFNPAAFNRPEKCFEDTFAYAEKVGIGPERIVFEVVESEETENPRDLAVIMNHCRVYGARVALDDLGAGYNSLNLLTFLQPDYIKLDMQLIRHVHRDPYKGLVAAKLLEMARELEVATVVEGIETREEWRWMREHGADYAQGYLFARPAPDPPSSQFVGDDEPALEEPSEQTPS